MSLAINSTVSTYTYTYQNQMRANLDKDDDGLWSRSEVQNYADSYEKATGTALDVDNIMSTYGNTNGYISYSSQNQMAADDTLGLSKLSALYQSSLSSSSTGSSSSSTSTSTSASASSTTSSSTKAAINSTVSKYTYEYLGSLRPKLDKDADGVWSREELQNYADSYQKATGTALDVDKILEKYGNGNDYISYDGQSQAIKADALGLSTLKSLHTQANAKATTDSTTSSSSTSSSSSSGTSDSSKDYDLSSMLESMSTSGKMSFVKFMNQSESISSLISNMMSYSSSSSIDMFSLMNQQTTAKLYAATQKSSTDLTSMSNQLMNLIA